MNWCCQVFEYKFSEKLFKKQLTWSDNLLFLLCHREAVLSPTLLRTGECIRIAGLFTRIGTDFPQRLTLALLWYILSELRTTKVQTKPLQYWFGCNSYVENFRIGNAEVTQGHYCMQRQAWGPDRPWGSEGVFYWADDVYGQRGTWTCRVRIHTASARTWRV